MEKIFAVVESGIVTNTILIDTSKTDLISSLNAILVPDGLPVTRGWIYNGLNFILNTSVDAATLTRVKDGKKAEIRAAFDIASNANITVSSVVYQGGYEKAMRLDAAKRLAELAGQTSTVFYDLANVGHTLTIVQAAAVVLAISVAFQTEFSRKQARMVAIDAATTVTDVSAIIY